LGDGRMGKVKMKYILVSDRLLRDDECG
jgi:hypothetical protein